jgi:hypothetical protein
MIGSDHLLSVSLSSTQDSLGKQLLSRRVHTVGEVRLQPLGNTCAQLKVEDDPNPANRAQETNSRTFICSVMKTDFFLHL